MKLSCSITPAVVLCSLALAVMVALTGCGSLAAPKLRVAVDAIAEPGREPGALYRLVAPGARSLPESMQLLAAIACVNAALSGKGMSEAPPRGVPDIFIELTFGTGPSLPTEPSMHENYLQLSATANVAGSVDRPNGPEIWNVRTAVAGAAGTGLPLLAAVAADYVGQDTRGEIVVEVAQDSPVVVAVRDAALEAVRAKPADGGAATPAKR